jgi:hypothetical protein
MSNPFDKLPLDVIHYKILPLLQYESRIALNMTVLKPYERKGTPLADNTNMKFRLIQAITHVRRLLCSVESETRIDNRIKTIIEMVSALRKHIVLFEHMSNFRTICLHKLRTFSSPTEYENLEADPILKNTLLTETTSLLYDIENNYPFKYNISEVIPGKTSFINGASPHHVVISENSTYDVSLFPTYQGSNNDDENRSYDSDVDYEDYYNDDEVQNYYNDGEEQDYYSDDEVGYFD